MKTIFAIPTYRRKFPKCLELLKQFPDCRMTLFVRKEEFSSGFYNHLLSENQIDFVQLSDCHDIGDTRQKIIEYCFENDFDYCLMSDDSVSNFSNISHSKFSFSKMMLDIINEITSDKNSKYIVSNRLGLRKNLKKSYNNAIAKCFLLDIKKLKQKNLNFVIAKECGHEDFVFAYECHIHGLMSIHSQIYVAKSRGSLPTVGEEGGTHSSTITHEVEDFINQKSELSYQYLTEKYKNSKHFKPILKRIYKRPEYEIIVLNHFFSENEMIEIFKEEQDEQSD